LDVDKPTSVPSPRRPWPPPSHTCCGPSPACRSSWWATPTPPARSTTTSSSWRQLNRRVELVAR